MTWDQVYIAAYRNFDCEYVSQASPKYDRRKVLPRQRKAKKVEAWVTKTRRLIESPNPPKTREEAVKALSPFVAYLLWSIFKVLAIQVIEWVWDEIHKQEAGKQQ